MINPHLVDAADHNEYRLADFGFCLLFSDVVC